MLIRGTVINSDGMPVEWASVWFAGGDHPTPDIAAITDGDGMFILTAPAPGAYRIGCRAEDHAPVEVGVVVAAEDIDVVIALPPAGSDHPMVEDPP